MRRGRRYGRLLTQACLDRARDLSIPTIFLYTGTFMIVARKLYEELGFKRAPDLTGTPAPSPTAWTSLGRQSGPQYISDKTTGFEMQL